MYFPQPDETLYYYTAHSKFIGGTHSAHKLLRPHILNHNSSIYLYVCHIL
jgi:hypothetical protein